MLDFFNLMFKEEYFTKLLRKQITIHHMLSAHAQGFKEKVWLLNLFLLRVLWYISTVDESDYDF